MRFLGQFAIVAALAAETSAITAKFDDLTQIRAPIGTYKSATWPGLMLAQTQVPGYPGAPKPTSGTKFAMTQQASSGSAASNASIVFQHLGHLSNFYFNCYSAEAAAPIPAPCEMTVIGQCIDNTGTKMSLQYSQHVSGNNMQSVSLSGATTNRKPVGSIKCSSYTFSAVPSGDTKTALPIGFYLDDVTYDGVLEA